MRPSRARLAVAGIWLMIGIGVLTNLVTDEFPPFLQPFRPWLLPALLVAGCLYTVVELRRDKEHSSLGESREGPTDRRDALRRVRARIGAALEEQFSGLEPLTLTIDGAASLIDAYDADQSLLVLGAAGAGKSTELWQLANVLATRAEDKQAPLPIVLTLAGWGRQAGRPQLWDMVRRSTLLPRWLRSPAPRVDEPEALVDWLLSRASQLYRIPPPVSREWLAGRRAVLILDGLDEVRADVRDRCVRELDSLVHDPATPFVVVSCRTADYEDLLVRPRLRREVTVAPLSPEQVARHLDVPVDDDLRRVVDSPLWLRVAQVVAGRLEAGIGPERLRHHLLDVYLTALVDARGGDRAAVLRRLALLANLTRHTTEPELIAPRTLLRHPAPEMLAGLVKWVAPTAVPAVLVTALVLPFVHLYGVLAGAVTGVLAIAVAVPTGGSAGPWAEPLSSRRMRAVLGSVAGLVTGAVIGGACGVLSSSLAMTSDGWRTALISMIVATAVFVATKNIGGAIAAAAAVALVLWWTDLYRSEIQAAILVSLIGTTGVVTVVSTLHGGGSSRAGGVGVRALPAVVTGAFVAVALTAAGLRGARFDGPIEVLVGGLFYGGLALSAPAVLGGGLADLLAPPARRIALAWLGLLPLRLRSFLRECARGGLLTATDDGFRFPHALVREHLARIDVLDGRPGAPPAPVADRDTALARLPAPPPGRRLLLRLRVEEHETPFTSPVEIYDSFDGTVLLVGQVGAGTSTLLSDLADTLGSRARSDPAQPVPLLLDLADLPSTIPPVDGIARPFTRWLAAQAQARYGVPVPTTMAWLADRRVVLLLDGHGQGAHPDRAAEMVREFIEAHDVRVVVAGWQHGPKLAGTTATVQRLTRDEVEAELGSRAKEFLGDDWESWAAVDTVDRVRLVTAAASEPDPAQSYVAERFDGMPPQARMWWRGMTGQLDWQVLDAMRLAVLVPALMAAVPLCFGLNPLFAVATVVGTALVTRPPLARPLTRLGGAVIAVGLGLLIGQLTQWFGESQFEQLDEPNAFPATVGVVVGLGLLFTKGLSLAYAGALALIVDGGDRLRSLGDGLFDAIPAAVIGTLLSAFAGLIGGLVFFPLASMVLGSRPWRGRRRFQRLLVARRLAARKTGVLQTDDFLVKRALGPVRGRQRGRPWS